MGLATGLAVTSNFVAADTTVQIEVAKQSTTEMVTDKKGEETQEAVVGNTEKAKSTAANTQSEATTVAQPDEQEKVSTPTVPEKQNAQLAQNNTESKVNITQSRQPAVKKAMATAPAAPQAPAQNKLKATTIQTTSFPKPADAVEK